MSSVACSMLRGLEFATSVICFAPLGVGLIVAKSCHRIVVVPLLFSGMLCDSEGYGGEAFVRHFVRFILRHEVVYDGFHHFEHGFGRGDWGVFNPGRCTDGFHYDLCNVTS